MLAFNNAQIGNFFHRLSVIALLATVAGIGFHWHTFFEFRGSDHLSDEVLIKNLKLQTEQYQQLISMFREDSPASIVDHTWIRPENVISADRWAEYKKLFKELELNAGMRSGGGNSIYFISTNLGLVTGGSSKGYMYNPEKPSPLYPSLNEIPQDLQSNVMGYRKINNGWYIVLVWDD